MTRFGRLVQRLCWRSRLHVPAEQIADEQLDGLWDRVRQHVVRMSRCESRCYVRVLAAVALRRRVELVLMCLRLPAAWHPRLAALATEMLTQRVTERVEAHVSCPARPTRQPA